MYKAVHAAGESLKSLSRTDPSMTYQQPDGSVFKSAADKLLMLTVVRSAQSIDLDRDILALKHPNLSELMDRNGHANTKELRAHILTNVVGVSQLTTEFERGQMDIDRYVERLLSIGQSEEADTDMTEGISDTATIVPATDE